MNNKILYIKYSELTLKQDNRKDFIKILVNNIKYSLLGIKFQCRYFYDYLEISNVNDNDIDYVLEILKNTPGIHNINIANKLDPTIDALYKFINDNISNFANYKTFKIECKRQNKNFPIISDTIKREVASLILKNSNLIVDLHSPELYIKIEVKNNFIIVWYKTIDGYKGLPIGSSGKTLVLLSGGIDSPVASKLIMGRGVIPIFLTFITPPHTCQNSLKKVIDLVKAITLNFKLHKDIKLLICNYTSVMHEISHIDKEQYKINLMRRSFFRISSEVAKKYNCLSLTTGESLGQVASQTQESLNSINAVLKDLVVIRPLIALDKNSIIDLAKKFDTYSISIKNFPDSCSLFAPRHPVTKPKIHIAEHLESNLDLLYDLEQKCILKIEEYNHE